MWKAALTGLTVAAASLALAAGGSAAGLPSPNSLPPGWTHVDINVMLGHQPHTVTLNRGRVLSATDSGLTLREADGSVVTVPVSGSTQYAVNGQAGAASIPPGAFAVTWQIDGNAAARVRAFVPPRLLIQQARRRG